MSKLSIVSFTDPHIRMTTPQARCDTNWLEQCLGQVEAVFNFANQKRARAVVCSGDVGDSPAWSDLAIVGLYKILEQYKHIPFITTVGQHDVRGHQIADWRQSSIGLLSLLSNLVTVLIGGQSIILDRKLEIFGFGFNEPETLAFLDGKFPFDVNSKYFRMALVHAQVGPSESMGWQGIENQKLQGCQVASFGDIHCGFEPYEFPSGTVAYSTGSLVRSSLTDMGRTPMCAVIEILENQEFTLDFHEIPDGDDSVVFYNNAVVDSSVDTAIEFKNMVQKAREHQDETPIKRLQRVGVDNGFTQKQIDLAINKLEDVD
jgi:hypothetical protein